MILKHKDDLASQIAELERLLSLPSLSKSQRDDLQDELGAIRAGNKGEKAAAYHIDFGWKDGKNSVVIHDLRIEHGGRVAQIDHLILMRTLERRSPPTKAVQSCSIILRRKAQLSRSPVRCRRRWPRGRLG
jgi:hypothetical protein